MGQSSFAVQLISTRTGGTIPLDDGEIIAFFFDRMGFASYASAEEHWTNIVRALQAGFTSDDLIEEYREERALAHNNARFEHWERAESALRAFTTATEIKQTEIVPSSTIAVAK